MSKYRKKPVVIEAHRIGYGGWPDSIWQGVNENKIILFLSRTSYPKQTVGYVEIHTLEGVMRGDVGDYIIRGVNGEFYPCKPDIFEKTYEPVEEGKDDGAIAELERVRREARNEALEEAARLIPNYHDDEWIESLRATHFKRVLAVVDKGIRAMMEDGNT